MIKADEVFRRFLQRFAREQGCELAKAAKLLENHEWEEIQYRHRVYPEIAKALRSEPIDFDILRQQLVKSKESPTGGHAALRGQVDKFLTSEMAEPLVRSIIEDFSKPPDGATINDFVRQAASLAFFTRSQTRVSRQYASAALFTSVLLAAAYPDRFVDYRQDRWDWAVDAFGLQPFPPPAKVVYGPYIVHVGQVAKDLAETKVFKQFFNQDHALWTIGGLVFLLCKDKHFKELVDMPIARALLPEIRPSIRKAFQRFRSDPEAQFVVSLRQHHAGELRELLADPEQIDLDAFNKEAWVYANSARIGEKDVTKQLHFSTPIAPEDLGELSEALDAGEIEMHGNFIWGTATRVYGTRVSGGNDAKTEHVRKALSILNDKKLAPREKATQIADVSGFGRNVTTGLCMVYHPDDVALYNNKSTAGVQKLGYKIKDSEEFEELAKHLKHGLEADDYLQLDWFLYLVSEGRIRLGDAPSENLGFLNTVLYGPPGTGKTYSTIQRAVAICDGAVPSDRQELVKRFKALQEMNRIVFVTFHQSYGYEEFVEGIRPVLVDEQADSATEAGGVRYECRDGIFKKLCSMAKSTSSSPRNKYDFNERSVQIWKMSLGDTQDPNDAGIYDECIENGYILLGYGGGNDFTGCDSRQAVAQKVRSVDPSAKDTDYTITSVNILKNEMQEGDVVVVSEGNHRFRAIGKVTGEYRFLGRDSYAQVRPVEWIVVYDDSLPSDTILRKVFSQMSLYQLRPQVLKIDALKELLSEQEQVGPDNYVLIVDEINRGNISKILGELITLLEPDKRLGGESELVVKLPYSGEEFGVPSNLYVLGTMNTADRSIAFLDTALRRRFRFEEVMPKSSVISDLVGENGKVGAVDVANLLDAINERIELLYDRDHQLGHSYFLQVSTLSDLRDVFLSHVLPLLQEYFYGDWEKICAVLSCPYDPETGKPATKNPHPILTARRLKADGLTGLEEIDLDGRLRYEPNPLFVTGTDDDLEPLFLSMIGAEDQVELPADEVEE